jgi:hypothetical protein
VLARSPTSILLGLLAVVSSAACVTPPQTTARKEVFVEPFREAEYELARLSRTVPFPLDAAAQPRCFSLLRVLSGEDERAKKTRQLMAASAEESDEKDEAPPDPTKMEKPPTSLIFPDRVDARDVSACYLAHCVFLDRKGTGFIHHVTLLVVNRERVPVSIPIASFELAPDTGEAKDAGKTFGLIAAATDRGIKVPALMEVPPGEQRSAHLFFRETLSVTPILRVHWTATIEDGRTTTFQAGAARDGAATRDVSFKGELVRRYACPDAPLSPLEDRIARGLLDLPEAQGSRSDWVDPGLSAVPGSGR